MNHCKKQSVLINWLCLGVETDSKISLEQHRPAQECKHHQHQASGGGDGAVAELRLAAGTFAFFYLHHLHCICV